MKIDEKIINIVMKSNELLDKPVMYDETTGIYTIPISFTKELLDEINTPDEITKFKGLLIDELNKKIVEIIYL